MGKGKGSTGAGRDGRYVGTDGFGLRLLREFVYRRSVSPRGLGGTCDGYGTVVGVGLRCDGGMDERSTEERRRGERRTEEEGGGGDELFLL